MSLLSRFVRNRKRYLFDAQLGFGSGHSLADAVYRDCMDLHYLFNVATSHRLIYIEVPKAGCTTIKNLLSTCLYGKKFANLGDVHERRKSGLLGPSDIGLRRFEPLLADNETLTFAVVREPFSRLRSCYLDKFAGADRATIDMLMGDKATDGPVSFEAFIRMACATAASTGNGHWAPMSRIIPMSAGIDIKIIKLENLADELSPVLDRLNASPEVRRALIKPLNSNSHADTHDARWTEALKDEVRLAYSADFALFGYPSK